MRAACSILLITMLSGCSVFRGPDKTEAEMAAVQSECLGKWNAAEFDLIRDKIEYRPTQGGPRGSDALASPQERALIARFAELYGDCQSRRANILYVKSPSIGMRSMQQTNAELRQLRNLQQGRITWDQFTDRRYAIINGRAAAQTAEDQQRHDAYMSQQRQQQQKRLEDAAQRTPRTTTTNCSPDALGGFNCTSVQQ